IRPASSNYLNYYIFSRIFGGGIVKLSRKIFTPQSWMKGKASRTIKLKSWASRSIRQKKEEPDLV
ncbi:hypothetical protein, partial [Heyndrickxia coagulans]